MDTVSRTVRGSSVAELAWLEPGGRPDGCGAVVLLWEGKPVVAFTYAYAELAHRIAAASQAALTFTETRSTSSTFTPAALIGRPVLTEDVDGAVFSEHLLEQELRRYPPARVFADSLVLRSEHWWYLPRLLVTLEVDAARPLPARSQSARSQSAPEAKSAGGAAAPPAAGASAAAEYVLAVAVEDRLEPHVVRMTDDGGSGSIRVEPVEDRSLPDGAAVLLGQDGSFPDLSQWSSWRYRGIMRGGFFEVTEAPDEIGLEPIPSVWRRMRRQQAFGRACRAGIARAERSQRP